VDIFFMSRLLLLENMRSAEHGGGYGKVRGWLGGAAFLDAQLLLLLPESDLSDVHCI